MSPQWSGVLSRFGQGTIPHIGIDIRPTGVRLCSSLRKSSLPNISFGAVAAEPGGAWGAQPPPMKKVGGLKVCLAPPPPQYLPSAPRSGDRWENFEVGAEHILDREVPFPAIWGVCKATNFGVRSAPTDGGAPLR